MKERRTKKQKAPNESSDRQGNDEHSLGNARSHKFKRHHQQPGPAITNYRQDPKGAIKACVNKLVAITKHFLNLNQNLVYNLRKNIFYLYKFNLIKFNIC